MCSNPPAKQGHPEQVTWECVQVRVECLQRGTLHDFPRQAVPVLCPPQCKEILPHLVVETCVLAYDHWPFMGHHQKESGTVILAPAKPKSKSWPHTAQTHEPHHLSAVADLIGSLSWCKRFQFKARRDFPTLLHEGISIPSHQLPQYGHGSFQHSEGCKWKCWFEIHNGKVPASSSVSDILWY